LGRYPKCRIKVADRKRNGHQDGYSSGEILGGTDGVGKKKCNSHWTDPSWIRGDGTRDGGNGGEIDIADKAVSTSIGGIRDSVNADIDNGGTWANMFFGEKERAPDGGDENIGLAGERG